MNAALWQVGWGYFLTNMIGAETGLSMASVDWARGHFVSYVRAGGPLPPLRVGRQPYGVLPVTSLDQWAPAATENNAPQEAWLKSFLMRTRDNVWRPVAGQIPVSACGRPIRMPTWPTSCTWTAFRTAL